MTEKVIDCADEYRDRIISKIPWASELIELVRSGGGPSSDFIGKHSLSYDVQIHTDIYQIGLPFREEVREITGATVTAKNHQGELVMQVPAPLKELELSRARVIRVVHFTGGKGISMQSWSMH